MELDGLYQETDLGIVGFDCHSDDLEPVSLRVAAVLDPLPASVNSPPLIATALSSPVAIATTPPAAADDDADDIFVVEDLP